MEKKIWNLRSGITSPIRNTGWLWRRGGAYKKRREWKPGRPRNSFSFRWSL